jgi:hypothetical protein
VPLCAGLTVLGKQYSYGNQKYIDMGEQQLVLAFLEIRKLEMWEN